MSDHDDDGSEMTFAPCWRCVCGAEMSGRAQAGFTWTCKAGHVYDVSVEGLKVTAKARAGGPAGDKAPVAGKVYQWTMKPGDVVPVLAG